MFDPLLREYQQQPAAGGLSILKKHGAYLDASDTGTGKTFVTLAVCKAVDAVPLVVAPRPTIIQWERAAAGRHQVVSAVSWGSARGSRASKRAGRRVDRETGEIHRLSVSDLGEEKAWGRGSYWRWKQEVELGVFDEVHLAAASSGPTLQSKLLIAAKRQFSKVICLSATAAESPLQMRALGYALGLFELKEWHDFLYEYGCKPAYHGGWKFTEDPELAAAHMARLHDRLFPEHAVRIQKALVPGFPKTSIETRLLQSEAALEEQFSRAEAEARKKGEAGEELQKLELQLIEPALEQLELIRCPAVLFVTFRETARRLSEKLGGCPVVIGGQDPEERQAIVDGFRTGAHLRIVATLGAGGTGISMDSPDDRAGLIFPTFDARAVQQAVGRLNRDGGGFSRQFLLGLAGTRHEEVLERVRGKLDRQEKLNDGDFLGS